MIGYRAAPDEEAQEWLYVDADGRELETVSFEVRALKSLRTK